VNLPKLMDYGASDRTPARRVDFGPLAFWFSYETLVAFLDPIAGEIVVRQNDWGPTTGKHINCIRQDRDGRLPREEFVRRWDETVGKILDEVLAEWRRRGRTPQRHRSYLQRGDET
jgi:hypothetical protein